MLIFVFVFRCSDIGKYLCILWQNLSIVFNKLAIFVFKMRALKVSEILILWKTGYVETLKSPCICIKGVILQKIIFEMGIFLILRMMMNGHYPGTASTRTQFGLLLFNVNQQNVCVSQQGIHQGNGLPACLPSIGTIYGRLVVPIITKDIILCSN